MAIEAKRGCGYRKVGGGPTPLKVCRKTKLTMTFSADDWVEIECALISKINRIRRGNYGPEEYPGEDKRWLSDLELIVGKISTELYGRKKMK